jgi:LacI family transcriptional regulator
MREIADLAGVSIATVSRVLSDNPDVSPRTRRAVLDVVARHPYEPRSSTAEGRPPRSLIAVTVPRVQEHYFATILGGISEALDEAGLGLVLHSSRTDQPAPSWLRERLSPHAADGAILMLPPESVDELRLLQQAGIHFAVIDPRLALDEGIPCVAATNADGARAATEHLLALGHRRIGVITGPAAFAATRERLLGVEGALAGGRVLLERAIIAEGDWQISSGIEAARRLLALAHRPTAIFAFNDEMAIGVLRAAGALGIRVPEELSVVGFDDLDRAELVTPQLTTVRQPLAEMGRTAVSLLLRLLAGHRLEALRCELATALVVRQSTAAVSSQD